MIIDTLKKIKLLQKSIPSEIYLNSNYVGYIELEEAHVIVSEFLQHNLNEEQKSILLNIQKEFKQLEHSIEVQNLSSKNKKLEIENEIQKLVSSLKNSELFLLSLNISKVKKEELDNFIAKLSELAEQNILLTPNAKTVRLLFEVKDESFTHFDFAKKLSTELVMYSSDLSIQFSKKECSKLIKEQVFTQLLN